MTDIYEDYRRELESLKNDGMLRRIPQFRGHGKYIRPVGPDGFPGPPLVNLSSNDYLGLLERADLVRDFLEGRRTEPLRFSSASSRLLTGNSPFCEQLETKLRRLYRKEAALVFNSGYHANAGILPALAGKGSLILADKLVHASLIDGIRLSGAPFLRFRHNDTDHLEKILRKEADRYKRIFVVTESIFSMDGDAAPLESLAEMKRRYPQIILYVDEAHAFGVRGKNGLGLAEELSEKRSEVQPKNLPEKQPEESVGNREDTLPSLCGKREQLIEQIDILVATFGKALSSVGAFAVCNRTVREYLVNKMRPLIFSTALPEINLDWSLFLLDKMPGFTREREHLRKISDLLRQAIRELPSRQTSPAGPEIHLQGSHIVPYITAEASGALELSGYLTENGLYALAVRPPTVPEGTSRLRFSLTAAITCREIEHLTELLRRKPL